MATQLVSPRDRHLLRGGPRPLVGIGAVAGDVRGMLRETDDHDIVTSLRLLTVEVVADAMLARSAAE